MSGSDVIVDPDPIPDPGTNPSVNEVSRKRAPSEQELEDLKRQTWYEFTNYFYHIRPAIKSLAADLPPNPFVDEDGGGGGSSGGYTPPDYNNNSISIYKNIMNLLGFKFISNDFHLYTFEWPTIRDLIVTNALVIVSAESNHRDYNHIWVLDGWWSYGEHLDKGGKIPVIYDDEDIQLFHCVWPSCKKNNGWFKISYSSIDSTPTVLEPGEQNNTISYKKIKFLNNKAVPNK